MGKPRKQWLLPLNEVLRRYGEGESSTTLAEECGLGNVRPILQAVRDAGMEVRRPDHKLKPRPRNPINWVTRSCKRGGCDNVIEGYRSKIKLYCSVECLRSDAQLRDQISESNTTHKLSDILEELLIAECSVCGPNVRIVKSSRTRSDGRSRYSCWLAGKAWYWAKKYNVSTDHVMSMLRSQDGKCGICAKDLNESLHVDHCHVTGKVRGLLCNNCNVGIGLLGDTVEAIEAALRYLR